MLFFKYLPPIGALTTTGMAVAGIFIGTILAYCTVGMIWPSVFALILLGMVDGYNVTDVFKNAFGHTIVLYMFVLLLVGQMLEASGLTQIFAEWLISRKIAMNKPWMLSFLIIFAAFFCALFIGMIAPAIICWTIVYNICKQVGYKKGDKWPSYMIFTIMFLSTVASFVLPFQLGVVANFGILTQAAGGTVTYKYMPYLEFTAIIATAIFMGCLLIGKYIVKPDVSLLVNNNPESGKMILNKKQKATLFLFFIFIIGLFVPSVLPEGSQLKSIMANMGTTGWSALIIAIGVICRIDKKPLIDFNAIASKGIIWDIILMMAALFTLSAALTAESTGFSQFILETLTPVLSGCGSFVFVVLMVLITAVMANLLNNIAVCAILIPIAYTLSVNMNANIIILVTLMNIVGNLGFLLPSSSAQAGMIYNNDEWIISKETQKIAIMEMAVAILITIVIGYPLANIILA
jgi:hypothetical protein